MKLKIFKARDFNPLLPNPCESPNYFNAKRKEIADYCNNKINRQAINLEFGKYIKALNRAEETLEFYAKSTSHDMELDSGIEARNCLRNISFILAQGAK